MQQNYIANQKSSFDDFIIRQTYSRKQLSPSLSEDNSVIDCSARQNKAKKNMFGTNNEAVTHKDEEELETTLKGEANNSHAEVEERA